MYGGCSATFFSAAALVAFLGGMMMMLCLVVVDKCYATEIETVVSGQ